MKRPGLEAGRPLRDNCRIPGKTMTVGLRPRPAAWGHRAQTSCLVATKNRGAGASGTHSRSLCPGHPGSSESSPRGRAGQERVCSIAPWKRICRAPTSWSLAACQVLCANTTGGQGHDLGSGPKRMLPAPGKEVVSALTSAQMVVVASE